MANSTTGIQDDIIARSVLQGYTQTIAPLAAFATDFSDSAANPGDRVSVPRLNSAIDAALDKAVGGAYTVPDIDSDAVEVVLSNHKYVSMGADDSNQRQLRRCFLHWTCINIRRRRCC